MSIADEIGKLDELRKQGIITDAEFNTHKQLLLDGKVSVDQSSATTSPASQRRRNKWPWWRYPLAALGILVGISLMIYETNNIRRHAELRNSGGMPACESDTAQADVKRVMENSPARRVRGLEIVTFENPQLISEDDDERHCRATITLNDDSRLPITYSFKKKPDGGYFIHASF